MRSPDDDPPGPAAASDKSSGGKRVAATETYVELMERLAPGTLVAGRYRIAAIAGVGGMGVVYRARDEELSVDVAVKVLRQDLGSDPRVLERFRSELLAARQVTHKNVVRLHDIGEHGGMRFLTMDYVEGRSLREILERDGPLPLDRAANVIRQVAEGLAAAHEKGIVHRDLKPGNILIDSAGTAFITDFGVARSLERSGLTRAGAIVGTPDYLSPEQVEGVAVDARSDLYALGIVFYEALSGELPFTGESQSEVLAQRLAGRPRDLKETGVSAPAWAREVLRRCLERNPSRRYAGARDLIEDLDRRLPRRGRGFPRALVAGGAAVLVLIAATFWFFGRPKAAPREPERHDTRQAAPSVRHAVAVLPLADQTGDTALAWTGPGIAEMLTSNLAESPNLRVLDATRVARAVKDLRVPAGPLEESNARQLAELWALDTLVTGTVRRAGSRVRVDLAVLQLSPSGAVATRPLSSEGDAGGDLFRLAGSLSDELRRRLGLGAPSASAGPARLTASVEAARAYEEGRTLLARGDALEAAPAFERAVASDPRFAAAFEKLAETHESLGHHEKAVAAADRALAAAGSDATSLSYRIRARVALLAGKPADAEKIYRQMLDRYPNLTEARLDLARSQSAQGHNAEAVATLKKLVESDPNDPQAWLLLGRNAVLMGDSRRAVQDYLVRALALQSQLRSEKGKADVFAAIAGAYQRLSDSPKALENYEAASRIQKALGDERGLATTLRNRALVYQAIGKLPQAQADLETARNLYEKIGDRVGTADAWNALGVIEESRGSYKSALEAYQSALKLRRELGNERQLAQSYDNVGYIYYLQGEYDNSLVYWQQALELRRKIAHKSGIVLSILNMGFLQTAQGHWDDAVRSFLDGLEKSREIDQKDATSVSLGNLGILHQLRGEFSAALSSYDEALSIARSARFEGALIEFTIKKGELLLEIGRAGDTNALLSEAEKRVSETGNAEQKSDLEVLRGDWSLSRGDSAGARRAYDRAIPLARKSGSRISLLKARLSRARTGTSSENLDELTAVLREAEALSHTSATLEASEALARAQLARRKFPEADRILGKAVGIAERAGWNEGLYRLYALRARAAESSGRRDAAVEDFARSARAAAKLRENVPPDMRASFDSLPMVKEAQRHP